MPHTKWFWFAAIAVALGLGPVATAAAPPDGARLYSTNCLICHGPLGDGKGPAGTALKPRPVSFADPGFWTTHTDDQVRNVIRSGKPGTSMRAFGSLTDPDLVALVAHLKTFKK